MVVNPLVCGAALEEDSHSLLCEIVDMFAIFDNIFVLMLKCLLEFGGFGLEELCENLVNIGYDGSNMFQGHRTGVTQQFKEKVVPFIIGVHCFIHKTNLVVITLLDVPFIHWLELLLQSLYIFFANSSKKFVEFQKLVDLFQTKGNRLLQNVKTH